MQLTGYAGGYTCVGDSTGHASTSSAASIASSAALSHITLSSGRMAVDDWLAATSPSSAASSASSAASAPRSVSHLSSVGWEGKGLNLPQVPRSSSFGGGSLTTAWTEDFGPCEEVLAHAHQPKPSDSQYQYSVYAGESVSHPHQCRTIGTKKNEVAIGDKTTTCMTGLLMLFAIRYFLIPACCNVVNFVSWLC